MDILIKFLIVFVVGGLICMVGQILILKTALTNARILVTFVAVGVLLGALQLFDPIREVVGAGITTPIVGFGGTLANGVISAVKMHGFLGIFIGGLTATAAGVTTAVTMALLMSLFFRSRMKK
jgi:stage V sporulation protein AE